MENSFLHLMALVASAVHTLYSREIFSQIQDVNITHLWVGHTQCGRSKKGKHPVGVDLAL